MMTNHKLLPNQFEEVVDRRKKQMALWDMGPDAWLSQNRRSTPQDYKAGDIFLWVTVMPEPPAGWEYQGIISIGGDISQAVWSKEGKNWTAKIYKPKDILYVPEEWGTSNASGQQVLREWVLLCSQDFYDWQPPETIHLAPDLIDKCKSYVVDQVLTVEKRCVNAEYLDCVLSEVTPEYKWSYFIKVMV